MSRSVVALAGAALLIDGLGCRTPPPPTPPGRPLSERRTEAKQAAVEKWDRFRATATATEHAQAVLSSLRLDAVMRDLGSPKIEALIRVAADAVERAASRPALPPAMPIKEVHDAYVAGLKRLWFRPWSMTYAGLVRTGATAMMESLDDGSRYEPQAKVSREALLAYAEGTFGLWFGSAGPFPVVTLVTQESPAARAGVQLGDQLVAVGATSTENRPVEEVLSTIRKVRANELGITVVSGDTRRKLLLSRDSLSAGGFGCRILARRALYLHPQRFTPTTLAQMRAAVVAGGDLGARVELDLRDTLGAGLEDTVDLANLLLGPKPFLVLVERTGRREVRAVPDGSPLNRARLTVLVDARSSGTTEIVAAAVQDQRRGLVVGAPTLGDTRVQDIYPLDGAGFARITSARALRVGGGEITGVGVTPDVRVTASEPTTGASGVDDQPCPGATDSDPVIDDPVVFTGLRELLGN